MTRHLHPLHWGQVHVDLGSEGVEPDLEETGFFRYVDLLLLAQLGEILDLPLQFLQGPLKIETVSTYSLDFERPLQELERQIEDLTQLGEKQQIDVSEEARLLQVRLNTLRSEIYMNLTPMQRVQVARH